MNNSFDRLSRMATHNLNALTIFVAVSERNSISAAARWLGISPSGASKAIARLEARLGVRLLHRTTRSVKLTAEGITYFDRCRHILAEIQEVERSLTEGHLNPRGKLTVQMPIGFGKRIVVPALPQFIRKYPEISLDVELADRFPDLSTERIDVAIRVGDILDSRVVAKKLCHTRFVTCASPRYLRRYGEPMMPEELINHRCLGYIIPQTGKYREWSFSQMSNPMIFRMSGPLNINNGEALVDLAIADGGIVTVASFIATDAVAKGQLRVILRDYMTEGPEISIVYMPTRNLSSRMQVFIRFISELIPPDPPWAH